MVRVSYVNRDDMDAKGQEIYDRIRLDRNSAEVGPLFSRPALTVPRRLDT